MGDYIKRDRALRAIAISESKEVAYDAISDLEAADVVAVTRCGFCRFNTGDHKCLNAHSIMDVPADDDYCSYGLPKER